MSITFFADKNRSLLTVLSFSLLIASSYSTLNAEDGGRVDPKSMTRDLDNKNDALADEEAQLLASMGVKSSTSKSAAKKAADTAGEARASIDLKKVADTIAHTDAPVKPRKEMAKPATMPVEAKAAPEMKKITVAESAPANVIKAAPRAVPQPVTNLKPAAPVQVRQQVVREVVKESDPQLRKEVTTMGNLFTQWQVEFEKKHAKVLDMQKKQQEMTESLDARIDSIERSESGNEEQKHTILTEENRLLREEKLAYENANKDIEKRLAALENEKPAPAAKSGEFGEQMKTLLKDSAQVQEKLKKQDEFMASLRLADGQLKHRMAETESRAEDAVREINSVKVSMDRIETNLAELSDQFVESLKYRPHAVYDANTDWSASDVAYDWNTPGPRYSRLPANAVMSDMPMVTVTETSANLWSGPEEDDKIVTTIKRGGQLAVEAVEHDWYRVILADGRRAWIPARSVIHNNPAGKDTTLRIASAE